MAAMPRIPAAVLKQAREELARAGGKARAKSLSPERASQIGRKAAKARWKKAKNS